MFNLSAFSLDFSGNIFLLLVSVAGAIALSIFSYRKTVPPVSTAWRVLLITLRALVIILIILILFEPILSITRTKNETPVVAVLVDNSASMSLVDEKVDRRAALNSVMNSEMFTQDRDDIEFRMQAFADKLFDPQKVSRIDSLDLGHDGTNITSALMEMKEKLADVNFAGVILISDGADNLGSNPARVAENYGLPIYTVGIGDPAEQKDILISNYLTNEVVYAGNPVPVDVYIKASGFEGQRVPITLTENNNPIDSKFVTLSSDGFEQKIRLTFTPESEGLLKYELTLPNLEGELTHVNNSKSFYVRVLKNKIRVLLVAGAPGADFRFLRQVLETDENIEVQAAVEKQNGRFYHYMPLPAADQMAENDCILLLDFLRRSSRQKTMSAIRDVLAKGKPVLFAFGKNTDIDKLWTFSEFLPFAARPADIRESPVYTKIYSQGLYHPVMRLSEDEFENNRLWQEFPPVFLNRKPGNLKPDIRVLAAVDANRTTRASNSTIPVVFAETMVKRKAVTILVYGLWRWNLMLRGFGSNSDSYSTFFINTIRWLTTEDDSKLVRVTSNKEIYRSGETVSFTAQVYFEDYSPVEDAKVTVEVASADEVQNISLSSVGAGRYEGEVQVLQGGDYQFTGTAMRQGRVLGKDSGKFSVEAFNLEFQNTRMNEQLMRQIAGQSGGKYVTSGNIDSLRENLSFSEKEVVLKSEWEVWNRTPMLVACLILLSTEWFIRKRKGML